MCAALRLARAQTCTTGSDDTLIAWRSAAAARRITATAEVDIFSCSGRIRVSASPLNGTASSWLPLALAAVVAASSVATGAAAGAAAGIGATTALWPPNDAGGTNAAALAESESVDSPVRRDGAAARQG